MWWSNFATTGNPNPLPVGTVPVWPRFQDSAPVRIVLDTGDVKYINEYKSQQCEFWREYYLQYYSLERQPPFTLQTLSQLGSLHK